ncbi:Hemicentin-1, partial [Geodia barretti]
MYPEDVSVEVHSTVSLACTAFGAPAPSVVWNSSGLPSISTNASGYTVENRSVVRVGALSLVQSVLHVCGFSLATAGSYTCSAENYAGTTSVTTTLSLNVPTGIAVAPNDTSVYVGDTVALSCVSHGLPFPSIYWTREGEPLRQPVAVNQTRISGGHVTFLQSTLLLCSLTLSDTGLYTCSASNNHSSARQTFSITVKVLPQIVIYPNDSAFFAGSTVRFSCTSYGLPAPPISWSRDSLDLNKLSVNDTRIHIWNETVGIGPTLVVRSHLLICGTVVGDSGNYSCTASTPERQDRAQFLVNVIGVPPTLIQTPVDVDIVAEKGNSIVAACIAYGNPAPVISWSLLPRFSGTLSTEPDSTSATEVINTTDSTVYTRQLVDDDSGVGMVYSSLLLCPAHQGLLVSSLVSCTASNGVSSGNTTNSHSFLINVTVEPQVLNEQTDHEGFVTETVSLVCRADGVPLPEILWLKDGCPLSRTIEELPRFQITQRVGPGFRPHVLESVESVL